MPIGTATLSSTPDYTVGYNERVIDFLQRAARQDSAGFLLPHLRPGMRVLDAGCGPGLLSSRLAEAVDPGELHGIDIEPSQVEQSRIIAAEHGRDNAHFAVADAADLPFDDASFDVVHLSGLLLFVPDTAQVLSEVKRVLKPGGMIGCRELMIESSFAHPELGVMQRAWEIFADLIEADDGHSHMARELKQQLLDAGFVDIQLSASLDSYSTPEELDLYYELVKQWFLHGDPGQAAKQYGAATAELLQKVEIALDRWRSHPGAVAGIAFGHALAIRP